MSTGVRNLSEEDEIEAEPVYEEEESSYFPLQYNDLDMIAPDCKKSSQHHEFIPVNDFSINHLPKSLQDMFFSGWLQNCVPFIVRVTGKRKATGRAMLIAQEINDVKPCPHLQCEFRKKLGKNHNIYGGLGIITNRHVVENDDEAKETTVEFFYHSDDDRDTTVIKERGYSLRIPNKKLDYSVFSCYTHIRCLPHLIRNLDRVRNYIWKCIPRQVQDYSTKYAIIISHPHGTLKKISIGDVVDRRIKDVEETEKENVSMLLKLYNICEEKYKAEEQRKALQRFEMYMCNLPNVNLPYTQTLYTTATCQGSSGAPVYMGILVKDEFGQLINQAHTHRGVDKFTGYNNCYT